MLTIEDLQGAHTYQRLSELLGIPESQLLPLLYRKSGYKVWLIPKKSGESRLIASPGRFRRKIQRALKDVFDGIYSAPESVHGFVKKRSVVTNASIHAGQRTLINLDLKDCFPSITFYRLRGLFLKHPFAFPWVASNILAHACTHNGSLPAGGITSPVIVNLILAKLDKRLMQLARRHGGKYSRYADDITFSFRRAPALLPEFVQIDPAGKYEIATKLAAEISSEGFESNSAKFRVSTGASRKVVTGLVVNERINLSRVWLRKLESEIYAIEKFGLAAFADAEFPFLPDASRGFSALRRVHGKIAYARMVRGDFDWVVAGLANRFNQLHSRLELKIPDVEHLSRSERLRLGLWVVAAGGLHEDLFDPPHGNGTGFTVDRGLIVTAYHVIERAGSGRPHPRITVREENSSLVLLNCDLVASSRQHDLAVLRLKDREHSRTRIRYELGVEPRANAKVRSLGYPAYFPNHTASLHEHGVSGVIVAGGVRKIRSNGDVLGGMSGGPLLDASHKVVGVTHRGIANGGMANEFISVSQVRDILDSIH